MSVEHIFLSDLGLSREQRAPLLLRPRVQGEKGPPRLAHLTAHEYVQLSHVPESMFRDYLTFAMVRDPFARTESMYRYGGLDRMISFDRFTTRYLPRALGTPAHPMRWFYRPQADFVFDETGTLLVDHLVRLEAINESLPAVLAQAGLAVDSVPRVNETTDLRFRRITKLRYRYALREKSLPALVGRRRPHWSAEARSAVTELYGRDFGLLSYPAGDVHRSLPQQ